MKPIYPREEQAMMGRTTLDPSTWKGPKRLPGEAFENYRIRRAKENRCTERYLRGVVGWVSRRIALDHKTKEWVTVGGRGTYVRKALNDALSR